jgi:membrane protein insertase Oxa1/YidC/SpoIIIJ
MALWMPAAVFIFSVTNVIITVIQLEFLKLPIVRRMFNIDNKVVHGEVSKPKL